ncbi:heme ABC exporter ATP-binding protein CcmA [Kaustia mangrovi]|uniref:Heme ABC exporter ATP-binding protein CcmA n=1 Tax=Kaustia mangrovi TaxID=2593653 RepID=A0A7S8C2S4_9HYPH|nr:heme ABC exporter ATP-binding protein CcmA [Kaustia mangrovi]QPC42324.1 heme ABC exporter ATP-binding protein CcmA [Kaustia mangrovi]
MELQIRDLTCDRGGRRVFAGLSLAVAGGEGLLLTGPNGSGKTSLLRVICGLVEPVSGTVSLSGKPDDLSIGQLSHYVAHADAVKPALTVRENLAFWARFLGGGDVDRALEAFDLDGLAPYGAGLLSSGQKRRLALSRLALVTRPIWLLDEPSVGLDTASQKRLAGQMEAHMARGGIVLAASHTGLGIDFAKSFDMGRAGARDAAA